MRCFLAIPLPEELRERINKLDLNGFFGKKVEKNNLHINLKFFGEIPSPDRIISKLEKLSFERFNLELDGFGVFPNLTSARVLFIYCKSKKLIELHSLIEQVLNNYDKRTYKPHVTLMRIKRFDALKLKNFLKKEFKYEFTPEKIVLYKSELTFKGPKYSVIKEFQLK